jgi:hypothetical protein
MDNDPIVGMPAWVYAGGQTIANGLLEFSGKGPTSVPDQRMRASLISILITLIVAPTLCLAGIRSRALTPGVRSGPVHWRASHVVYLLGMFVTVVVIVMGVVSAVLQLSVSVSLRQSQAVQSNKDEMINDLNWIAIRVREYRALPVRFGGGAGSYQGFVLGPSLAHTGQGSYTVEDRDSVVAVHGRSNPYATASIEVMIDTRGKMWGWTYAGEFQ